MSRTQQKKAVARELLARRKARTGVAGFYEYIFKQFSLAPFHFTIADVLTSFSFGKTKRFILNVPPGHIKSYLASISMPAFNMGINPTDQIIAASYGSDLATDFGREVRDIVASSEFRAVFPRVRLRRGSKAARRWHTNRGGVYIAAGVKKAITGRRANKALIDDPHEDFTAGNDLRKTELAWRWYTTRLYTRLMKGSGVGLIMQRMSKHDMTARLLKLAKVKGEEVVHINLAAVTDPRTGKPIRYDGTKKGLEDLRRGKVLWEAGFDMATLLDLAETMGAAEFNAMYQGIPDDVSGQIIKEAWLRYWSDRESRGDGREPVPVKDFETVIQSWDMRFKGDSDNDPRSSFVVGQVWGFKGPNAFLLDQVRGQWGFDDSVSAVVALSSRWPQTRLKLIENKANGPAAEARLRKRISGLRLVEPLGGDKEARLRACETEFTAGNVHFPPPERAEWVKAYVQRLLNFPETPNDEGDATSQALNWRFMHQNKLKDLNK
jgi:predicted phage terminase large subunit-like protein